MTERALLPGEKVQGDGFEIRCVERTGELVAGISAWTPALEQALRDTGTGSIVVSERWRPTNEGFERVAEFARQITWLHFSAPLPRGWEAIYDLPRLADLSLGYPLKGKGIDFSRFPALRELSAHGRHEPSTLLGAPNLEKLALYSSSTRHLGFLVDAPPSLRELSLMECRSLQSLDGLRFARVEVLKLLYLPKLERIADMAVQDRLRDLWMVNVRRIADTPAMAGLTAVEKIAIEAGPVLESFDVFAPLHALRELHLQRVPLSPRATSVAALATLPVLTRLHFWMVDLRQVTDLHRLGESASLERLHFGKVGTIASLKAWKGFPALRELQLGDKVIDGDLAPLLAMPRLEPDAWLLIPYRHYSHTPDEMNALLRERYMAHPGPA